MTFKDLLLRVRENILEAVEYQNFPLKSILSHLGLEFPGQEFPLFGTAVLLDRIHERKYIDAISI